MDAVICAEEEDEKESIGEVEEGGGGEVEEDGGGGEVEGREVDGRRKLCQHLVFRVRQCSFPSL